MLIVSDIGDAVVNFDQIIAVAIQQGPGGMAAVAFGPGVQSILTVGSEDRVRRCLDLIARGVKERRHILDLRDELGQRPNLAVPHVDVSRLHLPGAPGGDGGRTA